MQVKSSPHHPVVNAVSPPGYRWADLLNIAKQHKSDLISGHVIAILAALVLIPIPLLMPMLVDEVLLDKPATLVAWVQSVVPPDWYHPVTYILVLLLVTIVLRITGVLLSVYQTRQFSYIAKDITFRIRQRLLGHLQSVSMEEYETLGSGKVASHLVTDIQVIDDFIAVTLSRFIVSVLTIIGVAAILLWMQWELALFILLMNPVVIYFTMVLGKRVKTLKKKENKALEVFQQSLNETLDAIHQIRASNREKHYLKRILDKAHDVKTHSATFAWKSDAANRLSFLVFLVGFEVFRAVSMIMVLFTDLSLGQMFAVYAYLWFMMTPVQDVLGVQYAGYSANAALSRINHLLNLKQEQQYPHQQNPFENQTTVGMQLEQIYFSYPNGESVLNGVSLDIQAGEKVAFVGASGGGKSTLVQVILGLYRPQSGHIRFNGIDIEQIGLDVVRENIATVLQHPALLNDSIRGNLKMGAEFSEQQLWHALEIAQLSGFVKKLPEQLDTLVGQQGVRLSGGQRQRLAIARMVLSDPKVVILDEATSALDTETEAQLHRALHDFLQGRTTLIIAHRLSAVQQADKVFVFDGGMLIDEGVHQELIAREGLYQTLYGRP